MSVSVQKLWNDYGLAGILLTIVLLYVIYLLFNYFMNKGVYGAEYMDDEMKQVYTNGNGNGNDNGNGNRNGNMMGSPVPAEDIQKGNEIFTMVSGIDASAKQCDNGVCTPTELQNPSDLLPKDTNSEWAQLNPAGKGELSNINLLKAGYHIGIDTVGQTLRNANLQIRSEPPNPQVNVGPWNQSTITSDFLRPVLEIGQGPQ
jgi:hypothetical protein